MENDIPKIDLPDDWIIGNLSHKDIGLLSLYANYPCRLKAEIFVLCLQDRSIHRSDTLPSEARQLYHDPAGNNLTNS